MNEDTTINEDNPNPSIDCLREAKPQEDISIKNMVKSEVENEQDGVDLEGESSDDSETLKEEPCQGDPSRLETVFQKLGIATDKTGSATDSTISGKDKEMMDEKNAEQLKSEIKQEEASKVEVPPLNLEMENQKSDVTPQDDKELRPSSSSRFSLRGTPSGRLNRRRDTSSNVFPVGCMGCKDNSVLETKPSPRRFLDATQAAHDFIGHIDDTPRKKASLEKQDICRNPLTGEGIETVTEARRQCIKRKDGNPLLGTGYEVNDPITTPSGSSARIPPGGYSQRLW